ncbi:hypothetical protein BGU82_19920, partial [Clostridioides difficile]
MRVGSFNRIRVLLFAADFPFYIAVNAALYMCLLVGIVRCVYATAVGPVTPVAPSAPVAPVAPVGPVIPSAPASFTHLRAHEPLRYLACRLLLEPTNLDTSTPFGPVGRFCPATIHLSAPNAPDGPVSPSASFTHSHLRDHATV